MEDDLAEYDEYRQYLIGQKRKEQIQAFTAYDQSPPGLAHQQMVRSIMGGAPQKKAQPMAQQRRMNEDSDSV